MNYSKKISGLVLFYLEFSIYNICNVYFIACLKHVKNFSKAAVC